MKGRGNGVAIVFTKSVAGVGSEWFGLVRNGQGLLRVYSGCKDRRVRCV